MKRSISVFLVAVLALMSLSACNNSLDVNDNTVYVQKKGKVIGAVVESFDKDYYSAEELEAYVNERVEDYASQHGEDSVKIQEFSVEGGVAKLNVAYGGYEDYAAFNEVVMFAGTIPQAMAEGYDFNGSFLKVEDGKLGAAVEKDEVTSNFEYKVVILNEKVNVKVDGTILYASEDYTSLTGKDTVSIQLPEDAQDGEELALTYIIYQ